MNKTQLVDALTARLGDRRTAAAAVDGVLDTIVETVTAGDSVSITGFGVFEARARAARVARNPRTGEAVDVAATTVPAFRPGAGFRSSVGGTTTAPAPRATPTRTRSRAAAAPAAEAVEAPAKPARRTAAKSKTFAAGPAPTAAPVKAPPKGRTGAGAGKGAGKATPKAPAAKDSAKDAGKGKKGKAKK